MKQKLSIDLIALITLLLLSLMPFILTAHALVMGILLWIMVSVLSLIWLMS